jgi:hypothetical protein
MKTRLIFALTLVTAVMTMHIEAAAQVTVEASIAANVVDRMPQGESTTFAAGVGTVYCWNRVTGAAGTTIQHVWIHGEMEFPVNVQIGGSPWRMWTSKAIPPEWTGDWRVEIRDGSGNLLDTRSFTVGS